MFQNFFNFSIFCAFLFFSFQKANSGMKMERVHQNLDYCTNLPNLSYYSTFICQKITVTLQTEENIFTSTLIEGKVLSA